jgi:hypothetical protein
VVEQMKIMLMVVIGHCDQVLGLEKKKEKNKRIKAKVKLDRSFFYFGNQDT